MTDAHALRPLIRLHSSHWRHDIDLKGKRTPAWVLPRWDQPYGVVRRWAYRYVPLLQRLSRWRVYWFNEWIGMGFMGSARMQGMLKRLAGHHLRAQVPDGATRHALTPNFNPGCKRLLISNTWFPALQRPNVKLVAQAVPAITPIGVVGADGTLYPCDVIVWGTGFKATEFVAPMRIYGEGTGLGASSDACLEVPELGARWHNTPAATRLGITVAGTRMPMATSIPCGRATPGNTGSRRGGFRLLITGSFFALVCAGPR